MRRAHVILMLLQIVPEYQMMTGGLIGKLFLIPDS
jgi:hypothetical protein